MKTAFIAIIFAFSSFNAYASSIILKCTVVETWGSLDKPQQQSYTVSSSDPVIGFTSSPTTGFYAQSHIDNQIHLSTITQPFDGKNWTQIAYYRGGEIAAQAADFDHVKMILGSDNAGTPGESFQADCFAK